MNPYEFLEQIAYQLERWADESRKGGWSTHQVEPMKNKATEIFTYLGKHLTSKRSNNV